MGWIIDAPRFTGLQIEPSVIELGGKAYPSLSFAFTNLEGEPVTATLVSTPTNIKKLKRMVQDTGAKATEKAIVRQADLAREARMLAEEYARLVEVELQEADRVAKDFLEVDGEAQDGG